MNGYETIEHNLKKCKIYLNIEAYSSFLFVFNAPVSPLVNNLKPPLETFPL